MIEIFLDGDAWCVLYGENLQEGICGFGSTQPEAIREFATVLEHSGVVI